MNESVELFGKWWLPEHEDHKVFGTLKWDPEDGGTLQLHGELRPFAWKDNVLADGSVQRYREPRRDEDKQYPAIHGQADRRGFTLMRAFTLSTPEQGVTDDGLPERGERIHVNDFIEGALFAGHDDLEADRVAIDMRHLTGWVGHSGLSVTYPRLDNTPFDPDDKRFAVILAEELPSKETRVGEGRVRLAQTLTATGDQIHDIGVQQGWRLWFLEDAVRPLAPFVDQASDFQDLLSMAVGKTADFESFTLYHPAIPKMSVGGTPIGKVREDLTLHTRWSNRSEPCDPAKPHDMYFTFDHFGGMDGISRWLAVAEQYRTELGRVMATRHSQSIYLEDRIANVCAALDSFDKVRRNTPARGIDYIDRIQACIALAGQPMHDLIRHDADGWAKSVKEARHDLAHHRDRMRSTGSVGEHLLAEQLFWLFAICLLRLSDAPDAVFESIGEHRQFRWLVEQAGKTPK